MRLLIVGLDCVPPALAFERCAPVMPQLSALRARGLWGPLRSTAPPITVPAWVTMTSGRDPGELGLYGFRQKQLGHYDLRVATAKDVRVPRLWDTLAAAGKRVAPLFVPLTWPAPPVRGTSASCFLTPPGAAWTFPSDRAGELEARFGIYRPDVEDFRADDPARIWTALHETASQHFAIATETWTRQRPDFQMCVEMAPDRFHHAFWHRFDPNHPRYDPESPWTDAAERFYAFLDGQLGALLAHVDDDTTVMVVSDHGARPMHGGVAINDWLARHGWLALEAGTNASAPLRARVDWSRTRAWAEGGYYARVFLNVRGREPNGVIAPRDLERETEALRRVLDGMREEIPGLTVRSVAPASAYREVRGEAPELLVYLGDETHGDLAYRALGTVGHSALRVPGNDTGPDGCNHDWEGIFVLAGPAVPAAGPIVGARIEDVHATALAVMGVAAPSSAHGRDWSRGPTELSSPA